MLRLRLWLLLGRAAAALVATLRADSTVLTADNSNQTADGF
jgi:hypothetical protein